MSETLHSKIIGDGKPLLILHGFLGMLDNWKTLGSQYAEKGFQVHLIDQRNHGKSFWSEEFNYDILAEDLKNYMAVHELSQAIIIGHSMGGKTAMQFACTYSEKVQKLIVADIAPKFYPPHHQPIIDGLQKLNLSDLGSRGEADDALAQHIKDYGTRQFLLKNLYWKEKGLLSFRFNLEVLSQRMPEIGENIGSNETYGGPTLFLRGDRSEYIQEADRDAIKRHFPKAEIEVVDKAGHWLHAENPKQFFEKSLVFIED
ncbi:alpha/beta fold hydrolase [Euzebyella marina]|uniref:Alpha/beta fold hydrolase n=1 Tax=Euzebyella marina TaxID=1761453 RepID=A0A3G2L9V8_9FLAO|nr:alpha/beta fold hydrolase [Euzebyella marina]AYN69048.1 alpha/beta fold hydrolase [Euzebyella marina]